MDRIEFAERFAYSTDRITSGDRVFDLRRPLVYSASSDPETAEGFMLLNEELQSCAYGRTLDDAIDEVGEEFSALWDEIVLEEEDKLHESARHLRSTLLEIVEKVKNDA